MKVKVKLLPWTVAYQAPPSMGFSRQEYWSRLPFPSPGDLPDPGIEPWSPAFQADTLTSEPRGKNHSVMSDSATPWIVAYQSPQSMEFSRQEYGSGLPFPPPGDLPHPGISLVFHTGRQILCHYPHVMPTCQEVKSLFYLESQLFACYTAGLKETH